MKISDLLKEFGDVEIPDDFRRKMFTNKHYYDEMIEIAKEFMENFKGDINKTNKNFTITLDGEHFTLEDHRQGYSNKIKIDDYKTIIDEVYYYYVQYGNSVEITRCILDSEMLELKDCEEVLKMFLDKMRSLGYVKSFKSKILKEK